MRSGVSTLGRFYFEKLICATMKTQMCYTVAKKVLKV